MLRLRLESSTISSVRLTDDVEDEGEEQSEEEATICLLSKVVFAPRPVNRKWCAWLSVLLGCLVSRSGEVGVAFLFVALMGGRSL